MVSLSARIERWLRHCRMGGGAALFRRQSRNVWRLVCWGYPDAGCDCTSAASRENMSGRDRQQLSRRVDVPGDKAAAFGWFRLRALSTGRTADTSYSITFELRDGLIIKYHFLENTFDVAAAFRAGGSWQIDTDGTKHNVPPALEALEIQNVP
jgi:hypothetical protein